jgi:hypothetical protein
MSPYEGHDEDLFRRAFPWIWLGIVLVVITVWALSGGAI